MSTPIVKQYEKDFIQAMLTFLNEWEEDHIADLRSSVISSLHENSDYVEALYLGCADGDRQTELVDNEKPIGFEQAYLTLASSIENNVLNF
jgi:hypothetical protein